MPKSRNPKLVPVYTSKFSLAFSAYENSGKENAKTQIRTRTYFGRKDSFGSDTRSN